MKVQIHLASLKKRRDEAYKGWTSDKGFSSSLDQETLQLAMALLEASQH